MPGSAFAIMSAASRDRCRHSLSSLPLCTARALTDNPTAKVTTTRSTTTVAVWTRQAKRDATTERATVAELGVVASDADRSGAAATSLAAMRITRPSRTLTSEADCRSGHEASHTALAGVPMSDWRYESFWHREQTGSVIYS
jgi:hypothetical protein